MLSRSHALLQGSRVPPASLNPSFGCACASYKLPRRCYATRPPAPKTIAVLGGGITGLSTAYYLSKSLPNTKITLYEGSGRLGGWVNSKRVPVPSGEGHVTFEQGPRTLRKSPWALFTLELCLELGLSESLVFVPKTAPAARNRYIYDQDEILKLPASSKGVLFSLAKPTIRRAVWEVLREPFNKSQRKKDESVGDFLARRGLKHTSDHLASAFLHGIYAGNIDELSAASCSPFDRLWQEEQFHGSIVRAVSSRPPHGAFTFPTRLKNMKSHLPLGLFRDSPKLWHYYTNCSVFALKDGLGSLAAALEFKLNQRGVQIVKEEVCKLEMERSSTGIIIHTAQKKNSSLLKSHDLVISTLPAKTTSEIALAGLNLAGSGSAKLAQNRQTIRDALSVPTVTVMVVNLFYKQRGILPVQGFGYLIPQTVPVDQNPEMALGVIFDSDVIPEWDSAQGTKVTVMLGGHWWNGCRETDLPTEEEAVAAAKSVLARHLQIDAEPLLTNASLQKDCIPQYKVGHRQRMRSAHHALQQTYEGRVRVTGNSYYGVGVHDCIVGARQMAISIAEEVAAGEMSRDRTGLEYFARNEDLGWSTVLNLLPKELL